MIENDKNAVIKINGKLAQSKDRLIMAKLPPGGVYVIEAVYPSGSFLPSAVKFSPEEEFLCRDAELTVYSENVSCLKFIPKKYFEERETKAKINNKEKQVVLSCFMKNGGR